MKNKELEEKILKKVDETLGDYSLEEHGIDIQKISNKINERFKKEYKKIKNHCKEIESMSQMDLSPFITLPQDKDLLNQKDNKALIEIVQTCSWFWANKYFNIVSTLETSLKNYKKLVSFYQTICEFSPDYLKNIKLTDLNTETLSDLIPLLESVIKYKKDNNLDSLYEENQLGFIKYLHSKFHELKENEKDKFDNDVEYRGTIYLKWKNEWKEQLKKTSGYKKREEQAINKLIDEIINR